MSGRNGLSLLCPLFTMALGCDHWSGTVGKRLWGVHMGERGFQASGVLWHKSTVSLQECWQGTFWVLHGLTCDRILCWWHFDIWKIEAVDREDLWCREVLSGFCWCYYQSRDLKDRCWWKIDKEHFRYLCASQLCWTSFGYHFSLVHGYHTVKSLIVAWL